MGVLFFYAVIKFGECDTFLTILVVEQYNKIVI